MDSDKMTAPTIDRKIQILLIQMRKDLSALAPERRSFVSLSGLDERQFTTLDVFRRPDFSPRIIDPYDAIIIGGLSDDPSDSVEMPPSVFPFIENLQALMLYAIQIRKPSLLSCGGFMIASVALGSSITLDPAFAELGVYDIELTEQARRDPLFRGFPPRFKAVSGHQKSTVGVPAGCELLAYTQGCPVHAFKAGSAPFYAFQFHPEIRCEELQARVEVYKEKYFVTEEDYRRFLGLMADTSDANRIVARFLELVAG